MTGSSNRILVVDDEEMDVRLLERLLNRSGFDEVATTTDPTNVTQVFQAFRPDLVLLDLHMPVHDGFAVIDDLRTFIDEESYLPIVVLTGDGSQETKRRALAAGAKDFITKPFDSAEVLARVQNLLETRALHLKLSGDNKALEMAVRARTADLQGTLQQLEKVHDELRLSRQETIYRLSLAAEFRDDDTARHIQRMGQYCALLGERMGHGLETCEQLRLAGEMHDVGKIGIPDSILLKPGKLTQQERSIMETHSQIGCDILGGSRSELLDVAATVALTHHERLDGGGYPRGLRNEEIPIEGRIAAIADVFDALTSDRVYRPAFTLEKSLEIMQEERGRHFDPDLLDTFLGAIDDAERIMRRLQDPALSVAVS